MQLPDGNYRLRSDPIPPGLPDMRVTVSSAGMATNFGTAPYEDDGYGVPDAKVLIEITHLLPPPIRYRATVGGPPPTPVHVYTGDVVPGP